MTETYKSKKHKKNTSLEKKCSRRMKEVNVSFITNKFKEKKHIVKAAVKRYNFFYQLPNIISVCKNKLSHQFNLKKLKKKKNLCYI